MKKDVSNYFYMSLTTPREQSQGKNRSKSKESDNQSKQGLDHFFKTSFVSLQQGGFYKGLSMGLTVSRKTAQ